MKLSSAVILLALGVADARRAGTRRRTQTEVAPVEIIPDSDLDAVVADNGGGSRCDTSTGRLTFISDSAPIGIFSVLFGENQDVVLESAVRPLGDGVTEDISHLCVEIEDESCGRGRRAQEEDAIVEDGRGGCRTRTSIQCAPVLNGDQFVFSVEEENCGPRRRELQDVEEDMRGFRDIEIQYDADQTDRRLAGRELVANPAGAIAILACGPERGDSGADVKDMTVGAMYDLEFDICEIVFDGA